MSSPQLPLNLPVSAMQTRWKAIIDPLLKNPLNTPNILQGIELSAGATVINHLLGRQMQGWFLTDVDGAATIYRSAAMNSQTLTLTSDNAVTVNIGVF